MLLRALLLFLQFSFIFTMNITQSNVMIGNLELNVMNNSKHFIQIGFIQLVCTLVLLFSNCSFGGYSCCWLNTLHIYSFNIIFVSVANKKIKSRWQIWNFIIDQILLTSNLADDKIGSVFIQGFRFSMTAWR